MCNLLHHRPQPHLRPRQALRQPGQGQRSQGAQPWVAANGLPVVEQHNWLAVRRHLHGAEGMPSEIIAGP